jgi:hypothetical protein
MITRLRRLVLALLVLAAAAPATQAPAAPLGTGFTYQGQLTDDGSPVNGQVTLRFTLWTAAGSGSPPVGGVQVGGPDVVGAVTVTHGLFTVLVNDSGEFGAGATNGDERWLQVEVCEDPSCASATPLSPRQPLTATPYARFAAGPWQVSGTTLSYSAGNVGIGTSTPEKKLTVAGDMELGVQSADYRHLRIGGGNSSGFLYGSFPAFGDGIHLGYNFYADPSGAPQLPIPGQQTSRLTLGYGRIALAIGSLNTAPVNRLTVATDGNIGIGTDTPAAPLDVRGDVKLGSSGQYFAAGGQENLRIIRGVVGSDGVASQGSGYTSTRTSTGVYVITITTPFPSGATVTATAATSAPVFMTSSASTVTSSVALRAFDAAGTPVNTLFNFTIAGPR